MEPLFKEGLASGKSLQFVRLNNIMERWEKIRQLATLFPRTWSDSSGSFSVEARLSSLDGDIVTLRRVDNGNQVTLPLGRLSAQDVEFAKTFGRPKTHQDD